ncbi:MAG: GLPGLI family protein [Flavobacteriaceae bacterium]|nr:GLPGLI family protein [Flavobacteriaceae bacterium]
MKSLIQLSLVLTFICLSQIHAQSIQGEATYKSHRQMKIELDSSQVNDAMRQQIMAQLKKQFEREYTLEFTNYESIYKQVETLESTPLAGDGMQIVVAGSGDSDILYTNTKENRFTNQNEMFGKSFLIKDELNLPEWELTKETKNIGDYTCFKATYTYERDVMRTRVRRDGGDVEETPAEKESITVSAWYTPQIPVQHGPADYQGLPGMILEVNDAELTLLCSKIVLNPKSGIQIKEPTKGKLVNQEENDKILEKKMTEMNERFEGDGRREDGNSIEIRIGG